MAEKPDVSQETLNPVEGEQPQDSELKEGEGDPSIEELNKTIADLNEALKKGEVDKAGFIEQIKELRKRAQEAEAKALVKEEPEPKGDDVEMKVKTVLQKERKEQAERNRVSALRTFWEKHPEFSPDNDLSGLRMEAVNKTLGRFNIQDSVSVEDILRDYEDVLRLMKKEEPRAPKPDTSNLASESPAPGSPKADEGKGKLTPEQDKLRKEKGWTVEKYLSMKAKYPRLIP